jgi:hypothetical protein
MTLATLLQAATRALTLYHRSFHEVIKIELLQESLIRVMIDTSLMDLFLFLYQTGRDFF